MAVAMGVGVMQAAVRAAVEADARAVERTVERVGEGTAAAATMVLAVTTVEEAKAKVGREAAVMVVETGQCR